MAILCMGVRNARRKSCCAGLRCAPPHARPVTSSPAERGVPLISRPIKRLTPLDGALPSMSRRVGALLRNVHGSSTCHSSHNSLA
jgi:hypothetical protein